MVGKKRGNFSPEFKEEAARMVVETSRAIADVARELGLNETLSFPSRLLLPKLFPLANTSTS